MTPAVVCVHCSASSSRQWRPLVERRAARRRVLTVDLYGYGASPPWPVGRGLTLLDEAGLLAPLYEVAGGPVDLVGHSYGGAVALRAALADPSRVRSLVLFEPVLFN